MEFPTLHEVAKTEKVASVVVDEDCERVTITFETGISFTIGTEYESSYLQIESSVERDYEAALQKAREARQLEVNEQRKRLKAEILSKFTPEQLADIQRLTSLR